MGAEARRRDADDLLKLSARLRIYWIHVLSWEIDVKVSGYCDVLNPWNYAFVGVGPGNEDVLPATDAKWEKVSGSAFDFDPACGRWPSQMLEDIMTQGLFHSGRQSAAVIARQEP